MNILILIIIISLFILFLKKRFLEKFNVPIPKLTEYNKLLVTEGILITDKDDIVDTDNNVRALNTHSKNLCIHNGNEKLCLTLDDIKTMKDAPHRYHTNDGFELGDVRVTENDLKDIKNLENIIYTDYIRPVKLTNFLAKPLATDRARRRWLPGDRGWYDDWTSDACFVSYNVADDRKSISPRHTSGKRNDSYGVMTPRVNNKFLCRYDRTR